MGLVTTKKSNKLRASMFDEKPAKDYDPEAEPRDGDDDESGSEVDSDVERAETEHYVTVGKSKLRKAEAPTLGPEYSGTRVSRKALEESDDEEDFDDEEDDEEEDDEEDDLEDSESESESGSEEFADPDTADLERDHIDDDAEISSDNALGEDDENWSEKFTFRGSSKPKTPAKTPKKDDLAVRIKKRPTAADFMSDSEEDEDEEDDEDLEEDDEDEEDSEEGEQNGLFDMEAEETDDDEGEDDEEEVEGAMLDGSEDEEGDSEEDDKDDEEGSGDEDEDEDEEDEDEKSGDDDDKKDVNAELRKIMAEDEKKIVSTFSKAAEADAQKGVAVRSQRRVFDSILNLRIRLQKALIAANTFNCVEKPEKFKEKPYKAAEEAAVKLWNTIDSVRNSFLPEQVKAKAGEKRKRDAIDLDTPESEIWDALEAVEGPANKYRRQVLDKWSTRVRSTTASMTKERRLAQSAGSQSLVSVLDDQLLSADRLIKKARTPRSCAPAQAAKKVEEDADIYDDADFYQLLLKELVDQRSSDSAAPGESVATVRWAALKEAKTRKQVDRKASKGRKLRFTVHEKLQNFMAPEDRRSWEEHAIDRFFGTLFGQKMVLKEDEEAAEKDEDEEMGGVSVEEAGLKLFRS